jgi:hypothetical protein
MPQISTYPAATAIASDDNILGQTAAGVTKTWAGLLFTKGVSAPVTISASAIDWSLGSTFQKSISGSTTFTFSNAVAGQWITVKVAAAGANTVAWPTVTWAGGSTPTQTSTKSDFYSFYYDGTTYWGSARQNF